jgi:hypothetical protein
MFYVSVKHGLAFHGEEHTQNGAYERVAEETTGISGFHGGEYEG